MGIILYDFLIKIPMTVFNLTESEITQNNVRALCMRAVYS